MLSLLPTPERRVLIVGYGDLGTRIANGLVLDPRVDALAVAARRADRIEPAANLLRFTAMNHGFRGTIESCTLDLEYPHTVVDVLRRFQPTMVINCASVQSWRRLTELPPTLFRELDDAQFGPWLPMHLAPAAALAEALRAHGSSPVVVNCAFPDAVGPALAPLGLAPTIGAGNVANVVPALTWSAAHVLGLPVEELETRLVAQHYYSHRLPRSGDGGEAPSVMEVRHRGRVLDLGADRAAIERGVSTFCRRTGGVEGQALTASSVLSVVRALLSERPALVHAPAPGGLPGGYPVLVSRHGIELSLPAGLSRADAVRVNEDGQFADGISSIDPHDGTATIRPEKLDILARRFPVSYEPIHPQQAWPRAHAMRQAFGSLRHPADVAS